MAKLAAALAISSLFLPLLPGLASAQFRALCLAQFALANEACAFLPPSPPEALEVVSPLLQNNTETSSPAPKEGRHHRHGHGHGHGHDHGGQENEKFENLSGNGGGGGGGSNKAEMPRDPFVECCRWIKEMEMECVCDALRARLPVALVKPKHVYTLHVGVTCNVTYQCV